MKMVYCLRDAAFELENMAICFFRRKGYKQKKHCLFSYQDPKTSHDTFDFQYFSSYFLGSILRYDDTNSLSSSTVQSSSMNLDTP